MVGKAVNEVIKLIYVIEGYANNIISAPWKSKKTNLGVLNYIRGGKYPEAEVGKYVYAVREGQYIEGIHFVRIQLLVAHDVT